MENLKYLNKFELDHKIKNLAQKERDILRELLMTIKEIDTRKIYLELGFGSLFDYLIKSVGYSEGSAQRRIDAARLIRDIPEMAEQIQSGEIKLSQVSLVQKAARTIFKLRGQKVGASEKRNILGSLKGQNSRESQKSVANFFDVPLLSDTQVKIQKDESVRMEITLSKEQYKNIQKAQELLSHSLPSKDLVDFLSYISNKIIKQRAVVPNKSEIPSQGGGEKAENLIPTLSLKVKKQILADQQNCQFLNPETGRKCGSTWHLQIDHKRAIWRARHYSKDAKINDISNLQVLCAGHNQHKYRQEVGIVLKS